MHLGLHSETAAVQIIAPAIKCAEGKSRGLKPQKSNVPRFINNSCEF